MGVFHMCTEYTIERHNTVEFLFPFFIPICLGYFPTECWPPHTVVWSSGGRNQTKINSNHSYSINDLWRVTVQFSKKLLSTHLELPVSLHRHAVLLLYNLNGI